MKRIIKVVRTKLASLLSLHMILSDLSDLPPVGLPEGCEWKTLESGLEGEFIRIVNRAYNRNFILIRSGGKPSAIAIAEQKEWKRKGEFKGEKAGFSTLVPATW